MRSKPIVRALLSVMVMALVTATQQPALAAKGGKGGGGGPGGGGGGGGAGTFSCRASVARVEPAGLLGLLDPIELGAANAAGDPCATETGGVAVDLDLLNTLSLEAAVVFSHTENGGMGFAQAEVTGLRLTVANSLPLLPPLLEVEVGLLLAEATAGPCPSTNLQSESTVVSVVVRAGGLTIPVNIPGDQAHVDLNIPLVGTLHLNHQDESAGMVRSRALWLETTLIGHVIVAEAIADVHGDPCGGKPPKPPREFKGFMTGGGSIETPVGKVTHGLHLRCRPGDDPNNLQVNWGQGNSFHLEEVTSAANMCSDDPEIDPGQPKADFDTHSGTGTGRCNGQPATVSWVITDAGEPGGSDTLSLTIGGGCSLQVGGSLSGGNHQAHFKA